jgi:hypothetical protein
MKKTEDNPDMRILKTTTTKTITGKSTLTYQIGCLPDSTIHLRITKNSGGGFFSDEWVKYEDIQAVLKERSKDSPIMSHFISPLLKGKSSNTSGFIMGVLSHLKLLRPLPKKKRLHELLDPKPFLDTVEKLMSSDVKPKAAVKKTVKKTVRKAPSKKATVKTRTKKKATSRNNKTASS